MWDCVIKMHVASLYTWQTFTEPFSPSSSSLNPAVSPSTWPWAWQLSPSSWRGRRGFWTDAGSQVRGRSSQCHTDTRTALPFPLPILYQLIPNMSFLISCLYKTIKFIHYTLYYIRNNSLRWESVLHVCRTLTSSKSHFLVDLEVFRTSCMLLICSFILMFRLWVIKH